MDYFQKLRKHILSAHKYARKHLSVAVRHQRHQYHKERKDFHAGTKVWLFTPTVKKGSSAKLTCYWSGPWTMCAEPTSSEMLLQIAPDPSWAKQLKNSGTRVVSIDRLKLYNNAKAVRVLESEEALEMDDDETSQYPQQVVNKPLPPGLAHPDRDMPVEAVVRAEPPATLAPAKTQRSRPCPLALHQVLGELCHDTS